DRTRVGRVQICHGALRHVVARSLSAVPGTQCSGPSHQSGHIRQHDGPTCPSHGWPTFVGYLEPTPYTSQTTTVVSRAPEASQRPSGEYASDRTGKSWPLNSRRGRPLATSYSHTSSSAPSPPAASVLLSGENARQTLSGRSRRCSRPGISLCN